MLKLSTSLTYDWKPYSSNIYFKNTSHLLPCAGLGVADAGLFVVDGFIDGVTLTVENEIKGDVNRDIL